MSLVENLEKLRHFQKLSKYKSINEGSQAMGISQAGLSKSISSLEAVLEVSLFIRSHSGLELTKEGQLVLNVSKNIIEQAERLEMNLRSMKAIITPKKLRIGMYDSIAVYFFNNILSYFREIYKNIEISLLVDTSANLAKAVQNQEIDLAIGVNLESKKSKDLEFFFLFEDHFSFYISSNIALDLTLPLLLNPSSTDLEGRKIEEYLNSVIKKNGSHRVFNYETQKILVLQGIGIGVLPTQVAKPLVRTRELLPIELPKIKHQFGRHNIGFLTSNDFLKIHRDFCLDLYRLGERWTRI